MKKLTVMSLNALTAEGLHRDPDCTGLYVQVTYKRHGTEYSAENGVTRSWVYRYRSPITKKGRAMGLGSCEVIGIAEARELARAARRLVTLGADPIDHRKDKNEQDRQAAIKERASTMTFAACVEQYLADKTRSFKSAKHAKQYRETLERACAAFGDMNVAAIDTPTVIKFLTPMWREIPPTAKRIQGRIESVFDWATVHEFRQGPNPGKWDGHLEHKFTVAKGQKSHEAMPVDDVPAFVTKVRKRDGVSYRALEFLILTAARTDEVLSAKWEQIDLDKRLWTIPAEDMKAGKEHVVPLSDAAVTLLARLDRTSTYIFPGQTAVRIEVTGLRRVLKRCDGVGTVHGLRSCFRDWAGDRTNFDHETIEHALAHKLKDKAEAAYRRSTAVEKRRLLMEAWASYCAGVAEADNVVKLHG
jgi:integrase